MITMSSELSLPMHLFVQIPVPVPVSRLKRSSEDLLRGIP